MKELLISIFIGIQALLGIGSEPKQEATFGVSFYLPVQGGTGTSTKPSADQILIGGDTASVYDVKTLTAGSNITLATTSGRVTISSTATGGSGTVSTSTNEIAGRIPYWTSNSATPALLGQVATGTITCTGNASCGAGSYVIGSNLTINASSAGGSFPFSPDNTYNQLVYSSSTPTLWFKSGLFASSTSYMGATNFDGNVGIGTTSPPQKLTVEGTSNLYGRVNVMNSSDVILQGNGVIGFSNAGFTSQFEMNAANGNLSFQGNGIYDFSGGDTAHLNFNSLTSEQTYTFPDKSLTFAGINNETFTGLTSMGYSSSTIYSSFETASTSALVASNSVNIFGGGAKTTANALCIQLTGSADLCDSSDGGGGGGSAYEIATTSNIAVSGLSYFTKTSGMTTLGSVGTTTLTATTPLALSQTISVLGANPSVLTISTTTNSLFSGLGGQILVYNDSLGWLPFATSSIPILGDVTGTLGATVVGNDSHTHDATTISGLGTADISGLDISDDTNLAATWPIILSGDAVTFGGLSTSSAAVVSNIPYFSGVNTFANVATGTITCAGTTSCSTSGLSVIGGNLTITGSGSGGAFPFSADTNYGEQVYSTSTPTLWLKDGLYASSTSIFQNASTTLLSVNTNGNSVLFSTFKGLNTTLAGNLWIGGGGKNSSGDVGFGWKGGNNLAISGDSDVPALNSNTKGFQNTAIGNGTLFSNTTGSSNTGVGTYTLFSNITGNSNTGLGYEALYANESGTDNTSTGLESLYVNVSGSRNTANGSGSLRQNSSGNYNTGIGYNSLMDNENGSNNVALGYYAGKYEMGSNALYIDNQDRTNTAGDKAKSLLYGLFAANAADQNLTINAHLNVTGTTTFSDLLSTTNATSTLFSATTAWFTNLYIGAVDIAEYISDTAGAMWTGNTETDITITYDDADNTIDAVVDTLPNLTGTLDIDSGGTNSTSLANNTLMFFNGTSITSTSSNPLWATTFQATSTSATSTFPWLTALTHLAIPQSTNPDFSTGGNLAINTTAASSSIRFQDGTAERNLTDIRQGGFIFSTSTAATYQGTATSTISRKIIQPITVINMACTATTTGTAFLRIGDGTNWSETVPCTTNGVITALSTNNAFIMGEKMDFQIGTITSLTQYLQIDWTYRVNAD